MVVAPIVATTMAVEQTIIVAWMPGVAVETRSEKTESVPEILAKRNLNIRSTRCQISVTIGRITPPARPRILPIPVAISHSTSAVCVFCINRVDPASTSA